MPNRLGPQPTHSRDADCTVDPQTNRCTACGARHGGEPCLDCGQLAYHLPRCAQTLACGWLADGNLVPILPLLADACALGAFALAVAQLASPQQARAALEQLRLAQARRTV